jgi:hypothetical protein
VSKTCTVAAVAVAAILVLAWAVVVGAQETKNPGASGHSRRLVEVAQSDRQWTGVAVSRSGRVFVNFPRWSPNVPVSVGELMKDGSVVPYPNESLNGWKAGEESGGKFVCVQSVYVDGEDHLWILDPANPMFSGVVPGGAKLLQVDLSENAVVRADVFDTTIAPTGSYLNDVRVDTRKKTMYITDSGLGAIIVVDVDSGRARRLLKDHPSTKAEKITITIDGRPVPVVVHSDGIALDAAGGWLYYQALTGRTMYRVPTAALCDRSLSAEELAERVERFAESGVSDGLWYGNGGVYVSSLEDGAIKHVGADGRVTTVVKDSRIVWPDSFAMGPDSSLWFTTSQIHLGPNPPTPYRILKLMPE